MLEFGQGFLHDFIARGVGIDAIGKVLVRIQHRTFVPGTNLVVIGITQIERSIRANIHPRHRVIHHRRPVLRTGRKIVLEADGVPHFMR